MLSRNHLAVNKWTAKVNFLLLVAWLSLSFFGIHGQLDSLGFISIDCGYTKSPNYTDSETGITYVSDEGFTDYSGLIHTVNMSNMEPDLFPQWTRRYQALRFFPNGTRNCYTLRSLTPGGKYLVRAVFGYDNYDMRDGLVTFDLYLGVNYWTTVDILGRRGAAFTFEIIVESPANYLQVCLINTGSGTPFISGLDLRQFQANFYPDSNATQSLVLFGSFGLLAGLELSRYHFGTYYRDDIRYPDDRYDRIWQRYEDDPFLTTVPDIINGTVKNYPNDTYGAPSAVMRSVSTPVNDSEGMSVGRLSYPSIEGMESLAVLYVLYFTEVEILQEDEFREFNILLDDLPLVSAFRPEQMLTTVVAGTMGPSGPTENGVNIHSVYLEPTSNSKPPLISAMEIYWIRPVDGSATDSGDASAMMTIKTKYSVDRFWAGDPCLPVAYAWDGLNCTYNTTSGGLSRIIALYLSSSKLNGEIDPSFGKLTLLQHLDLSHNNLSGSIPNFFGQLPSLVFLDLSSNNLSGRIPTSLLQKSQNGWLTLRIDNNPNCFV
ncbi:putative leucine-rich repeat receptor-like serine/threonine-protein kinase At2g19230 [Miscanthus floridulus]|uniref:putative leucine-rich repeat receptor-like serine/threonine-protein kinase At2g19230 n=1 Tax=Miscanthus floridulus TaxID=154761 RepID=UPI00345AE9F8